MTFCRFYSEKDRLDFAGKRVEFANGDRGTIVDTSEACIFILVDSTDEHDCRLMTIRKDDLRRVESSPENK